MLFTNKNDIVYAYCRLSTEYAPFDTLDGCELSAKRCNMIDSRLYDIPNVTIFLCKNNKYLCTEPFTIRKMVAQVYK